MKKNSILLISSIFITSCGGINRQVFGITEKDLIKQVSVETGCAQDKISITDKIKNFGNATYSLDVCGKKMVYKQVGSIFMTAEQADKLIK